MSGVCGKRRICGKGWYKQHARRRLERKSSNVEDDPGIITFVPREERFVELPVLFKGGKVYLRQGDASRIFW